jgi:hypothetical protein
LLLHSDPICSLASAPQHGAQLQQMLRLSRRETVSTP